MTDWAVGDLAVCVDASHWPGTSGHAPLQLREGSAYRVTGIVAPAPWEGGYFGAGLRISGAPNPGSWEQDWPEQRFRKIRPDEHYGSREDWNDILKVHRKPADVTAWLRDFDTLQRDLERFKARLRDLATMFPQSPAERPERAYTKALRNDDE